MPVDLIDGILPPRRVHLLGGVSDAGKTRFVLPTLVEWAQGLPVLGQQSNPCPWVYVVGDRLVEEAEDTMRDMGLNPADIQTIPAFGNANKGWIQIASAAATLRPLPGLLVIEGFSDLCGESRHEVREFLGSVGAICQGCREFPDGLTVLGIVESPKQKPYEKYPNPRHRVSGTSAWGYHSSTILLLEAIKGDDAFETPQRTLYVCRKSGKRLKLAATFDQSNRLVVR